MELIITDSEVQLEAYRASHADFRADYGGTAPAPAHPNCTRSYMPGRRHSSHTPEAQLAGGSRIWPEGDAIIAALPDLLRKQTAREKAARAAAEPNRGARCAGQHRLKW